MDQPRPGDDEDRDDDERDRRITNIFLLVAAAAVVGIGIWLVNTMVSLRKATECAEQGRLNCNPIDVERDAR